MTVAEKILQRVRNLPEALQAEVLKFVEYLDSKVRVAGSSADDQLWSAFSLSGAMRDMESEPSPYSTDDLREVFR